MPVVSAVIPTYNRLPLLMEAVDSVRAQTFADWELVVADDGSEDGSADAMDALGDARIRVLRLPHTGNVAALRNAGIAAARGEWVAFLDSDDMWEPGKLQAQVAATEAAGVRWSYTGLTLMDDAHRPVPFRAGTFRPLSGHILRELLTMETAASISTLMASRALLNEAGGFDETLRWRADYDMALRLAAREAVAAVDAALSRMREHAGRSTSFAASPHEYTLRVYERFLAGERDPALRRVAFERCAALLLEGAVHASVQGRTARALRLLRRSLRYDPPPLGWVRAAGSIALRTIGVRR